MKRESYSKRVLEFYNRVYRHRTRVIPWGDVSPYLCDCCGAPIKYAWRIEVGEYPDCKIYMVGRICFGYLEDLDNGINPFKEDQP